LTGSLLDKPRKSSETSGIAKGGFQGFQNPPLGCGTGYNFKRNEILAVKENEMA